MGFIPWLGSAIGSLVGYLTAYIGKRWAVRTAIVAGFIAITAAFTLGLVAIVETLEIAIDNEWFLFGVSLMPENTLPCISAYFAAAIMRYVYDQKYSYYSRWIEGGL